MQKRKKSISILFVSDDEKNPRSLKLSRGLFKVFIAGIALIFLVIILSGFFSFKALKILADYENMKEKNKQNEEFKRILFRIIKKFDAIEKVDEQIRGLFGEKIGVEKEFDNNKKQSDEKDDILQIVSDESNLVFNVADDDKRQDFEKYVGSKRFIPSLIPAQGFLTRDFLKDDLLMGESHTGIDIVAKEGSVVRAVADGVVVFSNWTYEGGNEIILDHLNGFISFYKHNKRLLVGVKNFVRRGQPIALMGNSGVSSGTHLHFEIWKNGKPVDPREFIVNY